MNTLPQHIYIDKHGHVFTCAWCQREAGEQPKPGESHGICQRHKKAILADTQRMKTMEALVS